MTKYVILDGTEAVVFSGELWHSGIHYRNTDVTSGPEGKFDIRRPTSAGFVNIFWNAVQARVDVCCHGRSESLNLDSKEGDADLVRKALGL